MAPRNRSMPYQASKLSERNYELNIQIHQLWSEFKDLRLVKEHVATKHGVCLSTLTAFTVVLSQEFPCKANIEILDVYNRYYGKSDADLQGDLEFLTRIWRV